MRVLHVIDSAGLYGAETVLLNLCSEQARSGLEPIIASIGDPEAGEKRIETEARWRGVRVVPFRMRPGPNFPGAFRMLGFAREEGVDVLHSHGYKGNILFGFIPRKIRKIPMVTTLHGWTWTGGWDRMMAYEWLDSIALNFIDRVVVVDQGMKGHRRLRGRMKASAHVVSNGIPDTPLPACPGTGLDRSVAAFCQGGFTLGTIGRLSVEKGHDQLVEAVSLLVKGGHDIRLLILGEGPLRGELEKRVRTLGLEDRVLLPGYLHDARKYLQLVRLFVMPSHTEGLPMVILEAMHAGVPIVATRVGGIPELLQHGSAGMLVSPNAGELAGGIRRMLEDERRAAAMARHGKSIVDNDYSARAMARKYSAIYESMVSGF